MNERPAPMMPTSETGEADADAADLVFLPAQLRDADVRSELMRALSLLSTAVHHVAEELRAEFDDLPARTAIARWCQWRDAFDAIAVIARLLDVEPSICETMWQHASAWTPASRGAERPNEPGLERADEGT